MFNHEVAEWISKSISRMDPDEAEMFSRFFVYEVHKEDIENNRRTLDRHTIEVSKRISDAYERVSKARGNDPYDRDRSGRFARTESRNSTPRKFAISYEGKGYKGESGPANARHQGGVSVGNFDLTNALNRTANESTAFQEAWSANGRAGTNERLYNRITAGANLIGALPNDQAKLIGQVGAFAGSFGPEAEKVIGPAARRTAYRYRGTERMADKRINDMHEYAISQMNAEAGISPDAEMAPEMKMAAAEKAAVAYFTMPDEKGRSRIPSKKLARLQVESGKIPPSEGIIINAEGNIVTQAVGYNEDHYLPFNLKNLKGLQGGSYVRTRSVGGLTTEDIYTGLISGARSVTVVSRSGVFTVDFADDLRGGRRYSDKARQMIGQYAHTLDAIQSEKVPRRNLDPGERAAIREEVENELGAFGADRAEIETEIRQREKAYTSGIKFTKDEVKDIEAEARHLADTWTGPKAGDAAPRDPEARYRFYYSKLMDRVIESKESRMYQLDGEGYYSALQAMQEQFPYYIQRVDAKPIGNEKFTTEKDKGYVRPNYNRPKAVQSGYFDKDIEGISGNKETGKYSAASTHYQNYRTTPEQRRSESESEEQTAGATATAAPKSPKSTKERKLNRMDEVKRTRAEERLTEEIRSMIETGGAAAAAGSTYMPEAQVRMIRAAYENKGDPSHLMTMSLENKIKLAQELSHLSDVFASDPNIDDMTKTAMRSSKENAERLMVQAQAQTPFKRESFKFSDPVSRVPRRTGDGPAHTPGQRPQVYKDAWDELNRNVSMAPGGNFQFDYSVTDQEMQVAQTRVQRAGEAIQSILDAKTPEARIEAEAALGRKLIQAGYSVEGIIDKLEYAIDNDEDRGQAKLTKLADRIKGSALAIQDMRSIKDAAGGEITPIVQSSTVPESNVVESQAITAPKQDITQKKRKDREAKEAAGRNNKFTDAAGWWADQTKDKRLGLDIGRIGVMAMEGDYTKAKQQAAKVAGDNLDLLSDLNDLIDETKAEARAKW